MPHSIFALDVGVGTVEVASLDRVLGPHRQKKGEWLSGDGEVRQ